MQSETEMKERGAPPPYSDLPQNPAPQVVPQPVIVGTAVAYPGATVVPGVTATMVIGNQMGASPSLYICKSCNNQIITRVERKPSLRTHLFALLLCVVGCTYLFELKKDSGITSAGHSYVYLTALIRVIMLTITVPIATPTSALT